jgi:hypothetical protein
MEWVNSNIQGGGSGLEMREKARKMKAARFSKKTIAAMKKNPDNEPDANENSKDKISLKEKKKTHFVF